MKSVSNWNFFSVILITALLLTGCSMATQDQLANANNNQKSTTPAAVVQTLPVGDWASTSGQGEKFVGALLNVSENGAILDLGCGIGTISGLIILDATSSFLVEGEFQHQGGAEPVDGYPKLKAQFKGQLIGNKLNLTYVIQGSESENTVELTFGRTGTLLRCL